MAQWTDLVVLDVDVTACQWEMIWKLFTNFVYSKASDYTLVILLS